VQLAKDVGVPESNIIQWDMAETAKGKLLAPNNLKEIRWLTLPAGGPFTEIVESDIFVKSVILLQCDLTMATNLLLQLHLPEHSYSPLRQR
jgi:hypothetical protein